jgi:general secretion pathway protein D
MTTQKMIHHHSRWKKHIAILLGLCAALQLHAQFTPGGGFGGGQGGQGGGTRSRSGTTRTYSPNGSVGDAVFSIDHDSHKMVVVADVDTLKHISEVVSNLNRPQPQVLIKVVFVEVTYNNALDLGIEGGWGKGIGDGNSMAGASGFGLSTLSATLGTNVNSLGMPISSFANGASSTGAGLYQVLGTDYQVTLRAIAQAGKAKILSRPSILARNSQPATVTVGQSYPQISSTSYNTLGNAINSVTYTDIGTILKVTPYITADGMVQMILQPQISAVDPTTAVTISAGVTANAINIRSADTVVVTPDGQTVVVGGLIQDSKSRSDTKIPLLGDIPWLGVLFKHTTKNDQKTELIMFLTPHVVQAPGELAALSAGEKERSEVQKAVTEQELNRFLDTLPPKVADPKDAKSKKAPKKKKQPEW